MTVTGRCTDCTAKRRLTVVVEKRRSSRDVGEGVGGGCDSVFVGLSLSGGVWVGERRESAANDGRVGHTPSGPVL